MLVMEAAGAGEEEFPLCTGAGDLVTRCCLFSESISGSVLLRFAKTRLIEVCCRHCKVMWQGQSLQSCLLQFKLAHLGPDRAHQLVHVLEWISEQLWWSWSETNWRWY